ncbi:IS1595 family transposase [Massilia sp. PWRC2]|uniref:IS1595 family transposase n=1 Tax=Massilia sp. PWRC2 TaxID=2804626 RepID=UPI003CE7C832
MDRAAFDRLLRRLRRLGLHEREEVCLEMAHSIFGERTCALIEQAARDRLQCPRCHGTSLYRDGSANGLQRYRCRQCGRSFNALTGTPLARLRHKDRWLSYFDCLRDPACTVQRAADKVGVHANTSFRWRHRFLDWVRFDRPRSLQGIVEVDETFLLESQKGAKQLTRPARRRGGVASRRGISAEQVNIVVARDRAGNTIDFIGGRGALKAASLQRHLLPKLQSDALLVSDGNPVYRRFTRDAGIAHRAVNLKRKIRVDGAIHVQNVNSYHSRFKGWLRHFNGVATRYLANYLGWRWAIDGNRIDCAESFLRAALRVFRS